MCDEPVSTVLKTSAGLLDFQEYFVRRGQRDEVLGVELHGIEDARVPVEVGMAIAQAEAIILCPSNPIVSIGPILAVPGMREALASSRAPKVAVSPIIGGRALKGPADKMLSSLGHEVSATGVARIYHGVVDRMVVDQIDRGEQDAISALGMQVRITDTIMRDEAGRERLAREVLEFCSGLT